VFNTRILVNLHGATLIVESKDGTSGVFIVRHTLRFLAFAAWAFNACAVSAEPIQLNGAAIQATLPGSVLKLDTPLGMVVPIKFGGDGLMSGDAGQLASYLGSQRDRGRYWLTDDRICYKWFRWFSGEQHCLTIQRDGQRIFWQRDDGETGTATLEEPRKAPPAPAVTATSVASKSVRKHRTPHERATSPNTDPSDAYVPVLVKLPTLAVRPRKRAAVVAEDTSRTGALDTQHAQIRSR